MADRIVTGEITQNEREQETQLRPQNFKEFIGQNKVVENIDLMVKSSLMRKTAMDHVLLSGPPGLGKTSLAMLISKALGSELHLVSGPAIEKKGDIAAVLTNLKPKDVLFIDEIHRMHITVEEILYSAMEDFRLDILIGQGASARTMQIDLAPFTLIGATTRSGLLSNPLRDRFMAHLNFDFYEPEMLAKILMNNAKKMNMNMSEEAKYQIAKRSRGTPRIANRILLDIDDLGLDSVDRKILSVMKNYYQGGPVGIEALSATLGEDKQTIEDVYEPYLLKEGLILRTPRGRTLSEKAIKHLN
jgi:Holliday junction DNA helicase RuvB